MGIRSLWMNTRGVALHKPPFQRDRRPNWPLIEQNFQGLTPPHPFTPVKYRLRWTTVLQPDAPVKARLWLLFCAVLLFLLFSCRNCAALWLHKQHLSSDQGGQQHQPFQEHCCGCEASRPRAVWVFAPSLCNKLAGCLKALRRETWLTGTPVVCNAMLTCVHELPIH